MQHMAVFAATILLALSPMATSEEAPPSPEPNEVLQPKFTGVLESMALTALGRVMEKKVWPWFMKLFGFDSSDTKAENENQSNAAHANTVIGSDDQSVDHRAGLTMALAMVDENDQVFAQVALDTIPVFQTGERFVLHFLPNLPGYLDVFNVDGNGHREYVNSYGVTGGEPNRLPKTEAFRFVGEAGIEKLEFIFMPCDPRKAGLTQWQAARDIRSETNKMIADTADPLIGFTKADVAAGLPGCQFTEQGLIEQSTTDVVQPLHSETKNGLKIAWGEPLVADQRLLYSTEIYLRHLASTPH